jgi:hypothetical protein
MSRAYVVGHVVGEIQATDIPLSAAVTEVQLQALMAGDDDPLQVVIEVAPGKSSRGWNYTDAALKKLVSHVETRSLAGIMGHQREEDLGTDFRPPVTHWVGARWDEQGKKALFRGVVDKTAPDLKRWIRAGRVTQPSIFTRPTLKRNEVVDLEPLSIDWAPLDRAGMQTARVVAWGELADGDPPPAAPPSEGGRMERSEQIQAAAKQDARPFIADAAVHDPGWRDVDTTLRLAGELASSTNKPVGELAAHLTAVEAERAASATALAQLASQLKTEPANLAAAVSTVLADRDRLQAENTTLRTSMVAPWAHAVAGEVFPGEQQKFQRSTCSTDLLAFTSDKTINSQDEMKTAWGELKQTDKWKALLEDLTTGQTPTPPAPRTSTGSSGPDMSVFGRTVSAIGA